MYNDNQEIYDNNNNIRNKNQFELSLSNVFLMLTDDWSDWKTKKKQLLTLGRLHLYWMC